MKWWVSDRKPWLFLINPSFSPPLSEAHAELRICWHWDLSENVRILSDWALPFCFLVLHEAVSTGDPEMVYTVLQHRDYHNTSMALEGVPELLHKILEVAIRLATPHSEPNTAMMAGDSSTALWSSLSLKNSEYGVLLPDSADLCLSCLVAVQGLFLTSVVSGAQCLSFSMPL